ncbi:unnamed protein product [Effrenium voratum]|nr:unnamed protein product [Effrenium voratum]
MKSLLAFLLLRTAWASPWCATGIKMPDFREDGGQPSVEVMMAQSPLFSTNPNIGTKLQWLNLYHTALVFVQKVPGQEVKNWTVEFDSVTNVLGAIKPQIEGDQVIWDHDARFCATEGVLWGEAHWSKIFEVVLRLNADQARRIFTEFIPAVNETSPATKPLYQLMRAESTTNGETLVKDITCGDGAFTSVCVCVFPFRAILEVDTYPSLSPRFKTHFQKKPLPLEREVRRTKLAVAKVQGTWWWKSGL